MAAHLGIVDEEQINNMSYVFFENVLEELGHKLTYEAVVNYAGNAFCEKSGEMIAQHNPFNVGNSHNSAMKNLAGFFEKATMKIGKPEIRGKGDEKAVEAVPKAMDQ